MSARLVLCSKSPWHPALRREHAWTTQALTAGLAVDFVERPVDVRGARRAPGTWLRALSGQRYRDGVGPTVWSRSTPAPGHRAGWAQRLDNAGLSRLLNRLGRETTTVGMLPWQWPALASSSAQRRAFDCADDWARLIPARRQALLDCFRQVAAEADVVTVTSPLLAGLFPGRDVHVVRNGVDASLVAQRPSPSPGEQRLVYVGTLSERFDATLVSAVLERLPGWRVDLYGGCSYAGAGDRPGPDLAALLARHAGRAAWHGVVTRDRLPQVLDAADVLVIPNRPDLGEGQSSMKLYDYAARGRPVVTTPMEANEDQSPPHLHVAVSADAFAEQVLAAASEDARHAQDRLDWAARQTWAARWAQWSSLVVGTTGPARAS